MELLRSLSRGKLLFSNLTIYLFYHFKYLVRCLVQMGPVVSPTVQYQSTVATHTHIKVSINNLLILKKNFQNDSALV